MKSIAIFDTITQTDIFVMITQMAFLPPNIKWPFSTRLPKWDYPNGLLGQDDSKNLQRTKEKLIIFGTNSQGNAGTSALPVDGFKEAKSLTSLRGFHSLHDIDVKTVMIAA